jgi:hypothetical protein
MSRYQRGLFQTRSTDFLAELARLGVCLEVQDESRSPTTEWSDYSTCDTVLAERDLTEHEAWIGRPFGHGTDFFELHVQLPSRRP